jgi:hypothetical protein
LKCQGVSQEGVRREGGRKEGNILVYWGAFDDLNARMRIACQEVPFPKDFDMRTKSQPWIRSSCCCLKSRKEARVSKMRRKKDTEPVSFQD